MRVKDGAPCRLVDWASNPVYEFFSFDTLVAPSDPLPRCDIVSSG